MISKVLGYIKPGYGPDNNQKQDAMVEEEAQETQQRASESGRIYDEATVPFYQQAQHILQRKEEKLSRYDYQELQREYSSLKDYNSHNSQSDAETKRNAQKNRYVNVVPYNHNRVRLQKRGLNDYINASHLRSEPGEEPAWQYIVSQGPLPSTLDDFWEMILQQSCSVIVMLTRCVENRNEKCSGYFPQEEGEAHRHEVVEVRVESVVEINSDITLRKLVVSRFGTGQSLSVSHYLYHRWPDHGVPDTSDSLRFLISLVRQQRMPNHNTCVHCSAGIGRSGTFCTVDIILERLRHFHSSRMSKEQMAKLIDVKRVVAALRKQRYGMVQTLDQYYFCYMAVLEEVQARLQEAQQHRQSS